VDYPRPVCLLFAVFAFAAPLQAQTSTELKAGAWVRVQPRLGARTSGTLVALERERLRIESRNIPMDFALADIRRLEVSHGRRRAGGALVGAGIGLVGGVLVGTLISANATGGSGPNLAVIGVPFFATPAGAALGALIGPHRYREVPLSDH
jgi:hypothetical protein